MAYDKKKNFAISTIVTPPSPGATGLSFTVTTGEGAKFPTDSFNVVVFPPGEEPSTTNSTIVRVTSRSGDVFTLQGSPREQEGSAVRTIVAGDRVMYSVTKKVWDDIEANKVEKSGDTMTGNLSMGSNRLTNLGDPTLQSDAISRFYVDNDALKLGAVSEENRLFSNDFGDFTATPTVGAKTVTLSSYANPILQAIISPLNFVNAIVTRTSSGGVVTRIPMTNYTFASNVLTLNDMDTNFASGDTVSITVTGPSLPGILAMNVQGWNKYTHTDTEKYREDARELWSLGIRYLRLGGAHYTWENINLYLLATAEFYKTYGFIVEAGTTYIGGNLTAAKWQAYHDGVVAFAVRCEAIGLDVFMIGNELESQIDGTTLTRSQLWLNLIQLAADVAAVFSRKIVYSVTAPYISEWAALKSSPGLGQLKIGANIYGSGPSDTVNFTNQVNAIVSGLGDDGYVTEWAPYWSWSSVPFNPELQKQYVEQRYKILKASGIKRACFFVWKFHNVDDPSSWNQFAIKPTTGIAAEPNTKWQNRAMYHALFPQRKYLRYNRRSLAFDGSTVYVTSSIVPSANGISIGFWYNRQRYTTAAGEYIMGNGANADTFANAFRLFHDANSKNLVLSTKGASGNPVFAVHSTLLIGDWAYIAVTITSSVATLYVNSEAVATTSGNIGTPTRSLVIGGRQDDFVDKGRFFMDRLTIQNGVAWTQDQIRKLMKDNVHPDGSSWYNFSKKTGNDQSENTNHLTFVNPMYSLDVPVL
jgi:hypothetical protein